MTPTREVLCAWGGLGEVFGRVGTEQLGEFLGRFDETFESFLRSAEAFGA